MSVRDLYNTVAPHYDDVAATSQYLGPAWLEGRLGSIAEPVRAMDLGCATGAIGKILRRRWPDVHLTGIDVAEGMIDMAQQSGAYDELRIHDLNLPLPDTASASANLVVALGFSEFLENPRVMVADVARILSPEGTLFISFQQFVPGSPERAPRTTFGGGLPHNAYSIDEIEALISGAGLQLEEVDAVTGYVSRSGFDHAYVMVRARRERS
jgi:predicted TPR repeat methyltransferase